MKFKNKEHQKFYKQSMKDCKVDDTYHRALFYVLGLYDDTRNHISDLYDFETDSIKLNALDKAWQTSGTYNSTLFAFNLFNGYIQEDGREKESTPYCLFQSGAAPYFIEAIKIKFPDHQYVRKQSNERH